MGVREAMAEFHHLKRSGPSIDHVTENPDIVFVGDREPLEQALECFIMPMYVRKDIGCHE
jgi:hypothetical protein